MLSVDITKYMSKIKFKIDTRLEDEKGVIILDKFAPICRSNGEFLIVFPRTKRGNTYLRWNLCETPYIGLLCVNYDECTLAILIIIVCVEARYYIIIKCL